MNVKHLSNIEEAAVISTERVGKCKRTKKSEWPRKCQKKEKGENVKSQRGKEFFQKGSSKIEEVK